MANLSAVVQQLRKERARASKEVERLDAALRALSISSNGGFAPRRRLSAEARRKIAAAQRARWARVRREKKAA